MFRCIRISRITLTLNLAPLYNFGAFKFPIRIIGVPIFKLSLCEGTPNEFKEFKNSIVISIALS